MQTRSQDQRQDEDLLGRRQRLMGPTYRLFYEEPITVARAEGVWIYDTGGERYLDAYNNVPVVGHCHPKVVEALAREASLLNTHTRYLHPKIVDLADILLSTMPVEIGQAVFTCTGSEANDLAYRISKIVTGGSGFIVTENAYHGVTAAIAGLSPALRSSEGLGTDVYVVPPPSRNNGLQVSSSFTAGVATALAAMKKDGVRPAALLVDTIFSSDGVFADPPGFLAAAVDAVRDAGGLYIADEVQAGFGRTGQGMWGFQRHGVVPDLVTMGKPMGNGHPIAAVAARPQYLATFRNASGYFNTFGGNNVSAAVGVAVLKVIEEDELIANAAEVGSYLLSELQSLCTSTDEIADVRGSGMFIGVEMQAADAVEAGVRAGRLVNELRRRKILVGTVGRHQHVVRIRPPLPFSLANADMLLTELRASMQAMSQVAPSTSATDRGA